MTQSVVFLSAAHCLAWFNCHDFVGVLSWFDFEIEAVLCWIANAHHTTFLLLRPFSKTKCTHTHSIWTHPELLEELMHNVNMCAPSYENIIHEELLGQNSDHIDVATTQTTQHCCFCSNQIQASIQVIKLDSVQAHDQLFRLLPFSFMSFFLFSNAFFCQGRCHDNNAFLEDNQTTNLANLVLVLPTWLARNKNSKQIMLWFWWILLCCSNTISCDEP